MATGHLAPVVGQQSANTCAGISVERGTARGQELSNLNASFAKEVTLANNDGILYYGPDIVHWRNPEPYKLTQIVFAFREEDEAHCNNQ